MDKVGYGALSVGGMLGLEVGNSCLSWEGLYEILCGDGGDWDDL